MAGNIIMIIAWHEEVERLVMVVGNWVQLFPHDALAERSMCMCIERKYWSKKHLEE